MTGSPNTGRSNLAPLNRTLEQELLALLRGVSFECPACGEFVMHGHGSIFCPECGFRIEAPEAAAADVEVRRTS